jgi:hypothetical protein
MTRLSIVFLALAGLAAAPAPDSPEDIVSRFYATYWKLDMAGGVPDTKAQGVLAPYLSDGLIAALGKADKAEIRYAARTKNEVPPLIEGDLFTSLFEGASALDGVQCTTEAKGARCKAQLRYDDPSSKDAVRWSDEVELTATAQGWRIDDIAYGGDWEFMHKGRLREVLAQTVKDADQPLN